MHPGSSYSTDPSLAPWPLNYWFDSSLTCNKQFGQETGYLTGSHVPDGPFLQQFCALLAYAHWHLYLQPARQHT